MDFLVKTFIKDADHIESSSVRQKYGELSGSIGIVMNMIISIGKLLVGTLFASVSIVADGVNNLTDAASSIVTLVGFKIAGRPADEEHPFGHARTEYITALIVSFIILFLGIQLIKSSVEKILSPTNVEFRVITVIVLAVSIGIKLWLWFFNRRIGTKLNSTAILATATDSLNDVIATSAVLLCLVVSYFTHWQLDGYIGVGVALLVTWTGIGIFRDTFNLLIGEAPDQDMIQSIRTILLENPQVLGIHDLIIHNYGPSKWFASVHVEIAASDNMMQCHDMIDNLEREIGEQLNIQMTIHMDPIETNNEQVNELRNIVKSFVKQVDNCLSMHDFRVVLGPTHSNLIFDIEKPASCHFNSSDIVQKIEEKVKAYDEHLNVVIQVDNAYTTTVYGEKE